MRLITPIILIALTVALFFTFTSPMYNKLAALRAESASYNEALSNSKQLENERDKLTQKYNTIGAENIARLNKFLPENVDNIRLILEIEKIASPYGMQLKNVKYNSQAKPDPATPGSNVIQGGNIGQTKDYGAWDLEFNTTGSYSNLVNFVKDLEKNLRIVDVTSIDFSSEASTPSGTTTIPSQNYEYHFHIKTYWLKN
jgi:Tfp pilus assembly protein PilO